MIQNHHVRFRYVQRVLGIKGTDKINQYLKDNYYKVYHDVDQMFKASKMIVENWSPFKNHETFDYYVYESTYLFSVFTRTQECRTLIKISRSEGDNSVLQKIEEAIKEVQQLNHESKQLSVRKNKIDTLSRKLEFSIECLNKLWTSDELWKKFEGNIQQAKETVVELKTINERKRTILKGLGYNFERFISEDEEKPQIITGA